MTDILQRLHCTIRCDSETAASGCHCAEARDEIIRLRNELHIAEGWSARVIAGHEEDISEITRLRAENERLRAALRDARECIEAWAGYASEYFREKHALASDLARIDAALDGQPAPGKEGA